MAVIQPFPDWIYYLYDSVKLVALIILQINLRVFSTHPSHVLKMLQGKLILQLHALYSIFSNGIAQL